MLKANQLEFNKIYWTPENLFQGGIGGDIKPQYYISDVLNLKEDANNIFFEIQSHIGDDKVEYAYKVTLNKLNNQGFYERTNPNVDRNYQSEILHWEEYKNANGRILNGLWNEFSARVSSKPGIKTPSGIHVWPENWIWWAKLH